MTELAELDNQLEHVKAERAADKFLHERFVRMSREPKQREEEMKQSAADRKTFHAAAQLFGFSTVEANFAMIRTLLGPGFTVYDVHKALGQLAPMTQQEKQQREQQMEQQREQQRKQAVEDYNQALRNAEPHELRKVIKQEAAERRQMAQQQRDEEQIRIREEKDAACGFPPLPLERNGIRLDARFFVQQPASELRHYIKKYGAAQITARLREN